MNNRQMYIKNRMILGWILLLLGMILFSAGLALQFLPTVQFNTRIISGLGIFFIGWGVSQVIRYRSLKGNSLASARLVNEELDERNRLIRSRAGNRAFWVSLVITYAGLLWLSFASNGSLPAISPDGMWWYLAVAFMVSFGVYIVSIVIDQKR